MVHAGQIKGAQCGSPIFLHGAWRSGSTFYWSRFRALTDTLCYYEPLHHGLSKLTPKRIGRTGDEIAAALDHPALSAPYFAEFAPLIDGRGVRNYDRSLAYERFHLDPSEPHPALRRYVAGLVEHAAALDRRPVLGFNRSGGRVAWLRARFNSFDIHIDREPVAIWASYAAERAGGNDTFFSMWLRVLEANQSHPIWAPLAERLRPRGALARRLTRTRTAHRAQLERMSIEDTYLLVFYAWLATAPTSMAVCDLVIDDGLLMRPDYTRRIETAIAAATGLRLEIRKPRALLDPGVQRRVEIEALALFPRSWNGRRMASSTRSWSTKLCSRKADLIQALA
jgi:hypothetical protein